MDRHLARYHELKDSGEMPGLSLPEPGNRVPASSAADGKLRDEIIVQLCEGVADERRVQRFREAWTKTVEIVSANRSGICERFPYDEFWSHSLACGLAAHALSKQLGRGNAEEAFLCGFFYRVGALALSCAFPFEYAELMELRSLSELDELKSVERDLFGMDHVETSHAILVDLRMPDLLCATIGELAGQADGGRSELAYLVLNAEKIAGVCLLDESRGDEEWSAIMEMRRELGLERAEFAELGDAVVRKWWEYGDILKIHTRAVTTFLELDDTGITERSLLGLSKINAMSEYGSPLTVLIVDDDPTARVILKQQLVKVGYRVLTANDGADALSCALQHSPDVVIADWMMPEMDGLDLCRALRRYEAGRLLFFVLLTGRGEDEGIIEAFEAGVDDFFVKPTHQDVLIARMTAAKRVLNLRRQIEEDHRQLKQQLCRMAELAREAKDAAVTDSLTLLPNRRYATRRLSEEWSYSERTGLPVSIVMIDVDRFKMVNDTHGHDVGDVVLQRVAEVLREATRSGEVVCRFGGEEFIVICRATTREDVLLCAERLRSAVERFVTEGLAVSEKITVSAGVATRDETTGNVDALVRAADQAVYKAKELGRNQVCA